MRRRTYFVRKAHANEQLYCSHLLQYITPSSVAEKVQYTAVKRRAQVLMLM